MAIDSTKQLIARWPDPETAHLGLLGKIGIEGLVIAGGTPSAAFTQAAAAAGISVSSETALSGAVTRGLWPGIRRPGLKVNWENDVVASASTEPWIDSNLYLVPLERTLNGRRADPGTPVIAYEASPQTGLAADRSVPFETLELALIEARLQGGNYVLSMDPRYRAALLAGNTRALAAWTSLGRTAAWLRAHAGLFGLTAPPTLTALVEPGNTTAEIANLLYRRNGSPRLAPAAAPPLLERGSGIELLVAAGLKAVPEVVWRHAEGGTTVAIDDPALVKSTWRSAKQEPDREFFTLGSGRIVAYRRRIADPSEFALDMVDLIGHQRRTARVWNAQSTVVFSTAGPTPGEVLLHVVNYGAPQTEEVQARINGRYRQATLLRPESTAPVALKTGQRGLATEVFLPNLNRVATIRFKS